MINPSESKKTEAITLLTDTASLNYFRDGESVFSLFALNP